MKIRVLIVDDSLFFQCRLKEIIQADPDIEVIGSASNGKEAIEKASMLKPDVITMDIEMPVMDGITAVRHIMKECPTSILMIAAATKRGAQATFDAMEAGALDFLTKDFKEIAEHRDQIGREIRSKIISVAKLSSKSLTVPKSTTKTRIKPFVSKRLRSNRHEILAIGASTGGPIAIQKLLKELPHDLPVPVLVIQHMPGTFTPLFAERMNNLCSITVKHAENDDVLFPGCVYIAPGGKQMTVKRQRGEVVLTIADGDSNLSYKPCVDETFMSLAHAYPSRVLALVLTGMGSDGCEGAKKLKQGGSVIWAQDESSSVVYGMPMAVAKAKVADHILSIDEICHQLVHEFENHLDEVH